MINKREVEHIAKLARLGLTKREIEKMRTELSSILDYVETLKRVNISKIEPTTHSIKLSNVTRKDETKNQDLEEQRKIIGLAPETKKGYFKVKSIL